MLYLQKHRLIFEKKNEYARRHRTGSEPRVDREQCDTDGFRIQEFTSQEPGEKREERREKREERREKGEGKREKEKGEERGPEYPLPM